MADRPLRTASAEPGPKPVERPREKMAVFGGAALGDQELLALVLGGGRSMRRAASILDAFGGLTGLQAATTQELCRVQGMGDASAAAVCAAFELGRRALALRLPYATSVRCPDDVGAYLRAQIGGASQETFVVLGLDARQRIRLMRAVAVGTLAEVEVHPREVFRPLVRGGMHSAIVVHNHPSGDAQPSQADLDLTQRLVEVGRLVGIPIIDHLVVTRTEVMSIASLGLLP